MLRFWANVLLIDGAALLFDGAALLFDVLFDTVEELLIPANCATCDSLRGSCATCDDLLMFSTVQG